MHGDVCVSITEANPPLACRLRHAIYHEYTLAHRPLPHTLSWPSSRAASDTVYPTLLRATRSGCDPAVVRKVVGVRNALDRRIEAAVFDQNATVTDATRKAIRHIRTGRYDQLRLLALNGMDDNGTSADPLRSLAKLEAQVAVAYVVRAFQMLGVVIGVATPHQYPAASTWILKFQKVVVDAIELGTPIKTISNWVGSVWHRVSRDCRLYSVGESAFNAAVFDMQFLEQLTDERRDLESAMQERRAEVAVDKKLAGKQLAGRPSPFKPPIVKQQQKGKGKKRKRGLKPPKGKQDDADDDDDDDDAPEHGAGVDVDQPKVPNPHANKELKSAKDKQVVWDAFNAAHPRVQGAKPHCWDWWHPQGCAKGAGCKFEHA